MRFATLAMAWACVAAGIVPRVARGQAAMEVEFFDEWARDHYREGRARDALMLLLQAHRIAPTPRSLYNVAVVAQVAEEDELAYAFFEAYLATEDRTPVLRKRAQRQRAELARRLARIEVRSSPPGASIFIDRRELGAFGRTPRRVPIGAGRHTVTLELAGYRPATAEVTVAHGQIGTVELTLSPRTGIVMLQTVPPNGTVQAFRRLRDGTERAPIEVRSGRAVRLEVGAYRLRYAPRGHRPVEARVVLESDVIERRRLVATPQQGERAGTVLLNATASEAEVWIDGVRRAATPARLQVVTGPHSIEIRAGASRWTSEIDVRAGEVHVVNAKLDPQE